MAYRRCKLCQHPQANELNAKLLDGWPKARIASEYGASEATVWRHWAHLPIDAAHAAERGGTKVDLDAIAGQLTLLYERTLKFLGEAESSEDYRAIAMALRESRQSLEVLARVASVQASAPERLDAAERPDLDAAISAALAARFDNVSADPSAPHTPSVTKALPSGAPD